MNGGGTEAVLDGVSTCATQLQLKEFSASNTIPEATMGQMEGLKKKRKDFPYLQS